MSEQDKCECVLSIRGGYTCFYCVMRRVEYECEQTSLAKGESEDGNTIGQGEGSGTQEEACRSRA